MKQHVKKPGTKLKAVCVLLIAVAILLGLYRGGRWLETRRNNPEPRGNYQERKANEATVTYDGTVYRQRKNLTSILLMGIDHDSGETGGQADFLQLIVIDDTSRTLKRLSIDRDTMTPMPVDFYLAMNLDGIAALNDMAGGVTVTLADDFSAQDPAMAQGTTLTLHGDQAEIYVRSRRNVGVGTNEARMVRQEQYVAKLFAQLDTQMRSDQSFSGTMFDTLSPYLTTSIGRGRLINVVWLAKDYARQEPLSISGEHRVGSDGFMQFYADEASLYETVLDLFYEEVK